MTKNWKKCTAEKIKFLYQKLQFTYLYASVKDVQGPRVTLHRTKLAFTWKFIFTNKQISVWSSRLRYLPIALIELQIVMNKLVSDKEYDETPNICTFSLMPIVFFWGGGSTLKQNSFLSNPFVADW